MAWGTDEWSALANAGAAVGTLTAVAVAVVTSRGARKDAEQARAAVTAANQRASDIQQRALDHDRDAHSHLVRVEEDRVTAARDTRRRDDVARWASMQAAEIEFFATWVHTESGSRELLAWLSNRSSRPIWIPRLVADSPLSWDLSRPVYGEKPNQTRYMNEQVAPGTQRGLCAPGSPPVLFLVGPQSEWPPIPPLSVRFRDAFGNTWRATASGGLYLDRERVLDLDPDPLTYELDGTA